MLLTLSIAPTDHPATDLGYVLHKHPDRLQQVKLSAGQAHIFFPVASAERCTMALLLDIDPVQLSRSSASSHTPHKLWPYVNDRPYVCSSFMSVAIARAFGTALSGTCSKRPELVTWTSPMTITLSSVPLLSTHAEPLVRRLFAPLGYEVCCASSELMDPAFPEWGASRVVDITLTCAHLTVQQVLEHLYVLIPVLDAHKHYFIGPDEVDKLMRRAGDWLGDHPDKELIATRYLGRRRKLIARAHAMLGDSQDSSGPSTHPPQQAPTKASLHDRRLDHVMDLVCTLPHRRVIDLGCGEGKMLKRLLREGGVERVLGMDISHKTLERAARRLRLDERSPEWQARVELVHGSLHYVDPRLAKHDVALLVEVIEHIEEERLDAVMHNVLGHAEPTHLIITTPNVEYNALFETLSAGHMRHDDHRFEWDRATFRAWANSHADTYGYHVRFEDVGDLHDTLGAQTQLAHFSRPTITHG